MDYEKEYKKLKADISNAYLYAQTDSTKAVLESILPELKESEDELKWLTQFIQEEAYSLSLDIRDNEDRIKLKNLQRSLAWLEKQGNKEQDARYKDLEELLAADNIYQMAMNDEMIREAKEKAVNALHEMCIGRLLGIEKQGEQNLIMAKLPQLGEQIPVISNDALREGIAHFGITQYQIDNWLKKYVDVENQGEQKPADKVEPKFKVGDWVVRDGKTLQISHIDKVIDGTFHYWFTEGTWLSSAKMKDAHLWTIADAKEGDVLYSPCLSLLWIFKSNDTVYCGCNLNYNDGAFCGEGYFERPTDAIPATKEQRDTLFAKMKEAGYEWDAEKKELKKIEQKSAWSEEDELKRTTLIHVVKKQRGSAIFQGLLPEELTNWLKSLKDRVGCEANCTTTWKPSEDQMKALEWALSLAKNCGEECAFDIRTLHEQLEKL